MVYGGRPEEEAPLIQGHIRQAHRRRTSLLLSTLCDSDPTATLKRYWNRCASHL